MQFVNNHFDSIVGGNEHDLPIVHIFVSLRFLCFFYFWHLLFICCRMTRPKFLDLCRVRNFAVSFITFGMDGRSCFGLSSKLTIFPSALNCHLVLFAYELSRTEFTGTVWCIVYHVNHMVAMHINTFDWIGCHFSVVHTQHSRLFRWLFLLLFSWFLIS